MRTYHFFIFSLYLLAFGCKEEKLEPLTKGGKAPGVVTNVNVDNQYGKVVLTYNIPNDPELLYVKAVYENRPGNQMESIATFYNTSITLEGFNNTDEREVKLYSLSKSETASSPVIVKIKPLMPPIQRVLASLNFDRDFGGIKVNFVNEDSANIAIGVLTRDIQGAPVQKDMFYTAAKSGSFNARGFTATKQWFGLYVRDRWRNLSDTVWKELTPYFEQQLDKKLFKVLKLPTDANASTSPAGPLTNLWNNKTAGGSSSNDTWFRSKNGSGIPHWVTFDLGVTARISRWVEIPRGATDEPNLLYSAGDPQLYEIWGIATLPTDGSFNGWTKLATCEVVKTSGLPTGVNSNEDLTRAASGFQFSADAGSPPVRYIRIKMLQTFGNSDYFWMAEMTFFGEIQ